MNSRKSSMIVKFPHSDTKNGRKNALAQILASCSKYLIMLDIGMGISYATIAIPSLMKTSRGMTLTQEQASWYASLVFIWQPVGSITTVALSGFGRKRSMFYLQLPLFIAWLLPVYATEVWHLYFASSIMGLGNITLFYNDHCHIYLACIGIGFMQAPIATYIGEVCEPSYRGLLASIAYCFFTLGGVLLYFIDVIIFDWRKTAIYSSVIPPLTAIVLYFLPESPVWLISKGRFNEAKTALKWLRGWASDEDIEEEYKVMLLNEPDSTMSEVYEKSSGVTILDGSSKNAEAVFSESKEPFLRYCLRPEMYKPMILSMLFMYISNGTGTASFKNYLIIILESYRVRLKEDQINLYVTAVGLIGNVICVVAMPIVGKRFLTFSSVGLSMLGMFTLGLYGIFCPNIDDQWTPVFFLMEIFLTTNLGCGHIPWIIISEIFPLRGRTFATGFVAGIGNILQFGGTKMFWTYQSWLGVGGVFIMYAVTYLLGLIYLYYFLVETEGRTLDDNVNQFKSRKFASQTKQIGRKYNI